MDDLISRQAAIAAIQNLYPDMPIINVCNSLNRWYEKNKQYIECEDAINKLPSKQLERKKGKWIKQDDGSYVCSLCHSWIPNKQRHRANYCLFCGVDMREEKTDAEDIH